MHCEYCKSEIVSSKVRSFGVNKWEVSCACAVACRKSRLEAEHARADHAIHGHAFRTMATNVVPPGYTG